MIASLDTLNSELALSVVTTSQDVFTLLEQRLVAASEDSFASDLDLNGFGNRYAGCSKLAELIAAETKNFSVTDLNQCVILTA